MGEEAEVGDMLIDDDDDESACKYVNACDVYVFIEEKWRSGCCFLEGEFSEGGRYASKKNYYFFSRERKKLSSKLAAIR